LEAMLTTPTEQQVPPLDEFPEPPDTGTLVPVFDEMDSADTEPDDLTAINGIGPVFAARLHKGRIRTYAQLAAMDAERIAEIAGVPAARVTSADWIGQAKGLAASA
jgi:predicted flap endonuclease-1-like 5' DNA nuclease